MHLYQTHPREQQAHLKNACEDFVRFKDGLDAVGKNQAFASPLERLARKFSCLLPGNGEAWTATLPDAYCRHALPFSRPNDGNSRAMIPQEVDPRLVIGGTFRNYTATASGGDVDPNAVIAHSNELVDRNARNDPELPRLAQIGDLPLYVAEEGKNRVELFKRYRATMKAMVSKTTYPPPGDLQLVRIKPYGIYALKHGTSIEILPFPAYTVPMLEAYGVKVGEAFGGISAISRFCKRRKHLCSQQMAR